MAAGDIALGVVNWKGDAFAVKKADEILRVQPLDEFRRIAAPVGELFTVFGGECGNA
jgi:hypothetical protein